MKLAVDLVGAHPFAFQEVGINKLQVLQVNVAQELGHKHGGVFGAEQLQNGHLLVGQAEQRAFFILRVYADIEKVEFCT